MHNIPGFNNIFFCDDLSMFTKRTAGMQRLLGVIEEFENWSGIRLNLKKTLVAHVGKKAKQRHPEPELWYKGKKLKVIDETEAIRNLGYWSTADGDYAEAKRRVLKRTRDAIERIRHHPFTPEMAWVIF